MRILLSSFTSPATGGRIESGPHVGEYLLPVDTTYDTDETVAETAISGTEFTNGVCFKFCDSLKESIGEHSRLHLF